jgi:hypothetical protein
MTRPTPASYRMVALGFVLAATVTFATTLAQKPNAELN